MYTWRHQKLGRLGRNRIAVGRFASVLGGRRPQSCHGTTRMRNTWRLVLPRLGPSFQCRDRSTPAVLLKRRRSRGRLRHLAAGRHEECRTISNHGGAQHREPPRRIAQPVISPDCHDPDQQFYPIRKDGVNVANGEWQNCANKETAIARRLRRQSARSMARRVTVSLSKVYQIR